MINGHAAEAGTDHFDHFDIDLEDPDMSSFTFGDWKAFPVMGAMSACAMRAVGERWKD